MMSGSALLINPLLELETQLTYLQASRYVTAVGVVALLYNHLLTLGDEVKLIWPGKVSLPKVLFFFNRYMVPLAVIIQVTSTSGISSPHLTKKFCQGWVSVVTSIGMLSIASGNLLVLLRLWVLWERSFPLICWTLSVFVATQIAAITLTSYLITKMLPILIYSIGLRTCMFSTEISFTVLWIPGLTFEIMVFITAVWNVFDRPRSQDSKMTKILYNDGFNHFFVLFVLRVANLILSIFAPLYIAILGINFCWCATSITITRFIINLRRIALTEKLELDDTPELLPRLNTAATLTTQEIEMAHCHSTSIISNNSSIPTL